MNNQVALTDAEVVISTIIDDWMQRGDKDMVGSRPVRNLKQSLYENLKLFKDLENLK